MCGQRLLFFFPKKNFFNGMPQPNSASIAARMRLFAYANRHILFRTSLPIIICYLADILGKVNNLI